MDINLIDHIKAIWSVAPEKSWDGILKALKEEKDKKALGIDDKIIGKLTKAINGLKNIGEKFPDSPETLADMVKNRL